MPPGGSQSPRKLVGLAGFMGCGKSTVGRLLAARLGWRFVDLDPLIEERAGISIAQIFERLGEPAFREMEQETLARVLGEAVEQAKPTVIALGGGTFAQPTAAEMLRAAACAVVWLHCPTGVLLARCATMNNRPLFRDEASFLALYAQRLPFYERAEYCVDGNSNPQTVVERILAQDIFERVSI
jgi:shikimate kinase